MMILLREYFAESPASAGPGPFRFLLHKTGKNTEQKDSSLRTVPLGTKQWG